ncbi:hypothetical protein [Streptomyces sp. NPDC126499]|uniref:hypothetical protein n=1 Tax=Streptomyces sp. NPDC126499 TaxID=3155314 RepID=UPI00332DDD0F
MSSSTPFRGRRPVLRARATVVAALAVGAVMALAPAAAAAPGDLDPSFSGDGQTTVDFGMTPPEPEVGNDVLRTADGSLFTVGRSGLNVPLVGGGNAFGITKHDAAGTLDTAFDGDSGTADGRVTVEFGDTVAIARSVVETSDGGILVGGLTRQEQIADGALAKLDPDTGELDTSFGGDGKVTFNPTLGGLLGTGVRGMSQAPGGDILVAGAAGPDSFVARFNSDGTPDTGFGAGDGDGVDGVVLRDFGAGDHFFAAEELPGGKFIAAGTTADTQHLSADGDFLLARFNSDGTLDTTFGGGDGIVTTDMSGGLFDLAFGFTTAPGGDYVIVGAAGAPEPFGQGGPLRHAIARYDSDGTLDTGFSADGRLTVDVDSVTADEARDVAVDGDGNIVTVGLTGEVSPFPLDPTAGDACVLRVEPDGDLDATFGGGDGIAVIDFAGLADVARGIALDDDDDIIFAGGATDSDPLGTRLDFALGRLQS